MRLRNGNLDTKKVGLHTAAAVAQGRGKADRGKRGILCVSFLKPLLFCRGATSALLKGHVREFCFRPTFFRDKALRSREPRRFVGMFGAERLDGLRGEMRIFAAIMAPASPLHHDIIETRQTGYERKAPRTAAHSLPAVRLKVSPRVPATSSFSVARWASRAGCHTSTPAPVSWLLWAQQSGEWLVVCAVPRRSCRRPRPVGWGDRQAPLQADPPQAGEGIKKVLVFENGVCCRNCSVGGFRWLESRGLQDKLKHHELQTAPQIVQAKPTLPVPSRQHDSHTAHRSLSKTKSAHVCHGQKGQGDGQEG